MKLFDAYAQAIEEEDDPQEREEFSSDSELKTVVAEEIIEAFKEIRENRTISKEAIDVLDPMFKCVAFWFIIGIRVGKILRDEELSR